MPVHIWKLIKNYISFQNCQNGNLGKKLFEPEILSPLLGCQICGLLPNVKNLCVCAKNYVYGNVSRVIQV